MPTIHREDGFEIVIRTLDHPPPHVHVLHAEEEVVFNLGSGAEPPSLRRVVDMKPSNARRALRIVERNRDALLAAWEKYHGS